MNMKISQYVYFIEKKNKVLCYSTLYNEVALISLNAYKTIQRKISECLQFIGSQ